MVAESPNRAAQNAPREVSEEEILERLREVIRHGYGRLEVVVRDHQISSLQWQKTLVKGGEKPD